MNYPPRIDFNPTPYTPSFPINPPMTPSWNTESLTQDTRLQPKTGIIEDLTVDNSINLQLIDDAGMLRKGIFQNELPPLTPSSITNIKDWLNITITRAKQTCKPITICRLLDFIEQRIRGGSVKDVELYGKGLFRLLILSKYFQQQMKSQHVSHSEIISTSSLKQIAHRLKGMEIRVSIEVQEGQDLSAVLRDLKSAIANFLSPTNRTKRHSPFKIETLGDIVSIKFHQGSEENIVIKVEGKQDTSSLAPQALKVPIKDLLRDGGPMKQITPMSDSRTPWQPFFNIIHGIPLAALNHQGPGRDFIRLMDSYTNRCRYIDAWSENMIKNDFLFPQKNSEYRIRNIIELLTEHLHEEGVSDPSKAYALTFQTCYSLELKDEECSLIWKAIQTLYKKGDRSKTPLSIIAELIATNKASFSFVSSLIEVTAYLNLHTWPGVFSGKPRIDTELTRMNDSFGMRVAIQEPMCTNHLLLSLKPLDSLKILEREYSRLSMDKGKDILSDILSLYQMLLSNSPINQHQPTPEIFYLIQHNFALGDYEIESISSLTNHPSPLLTNLGLHLLCAAHAQGGRAPYVSLNFLPRGLSLPNASESHAALLQSVEQCLSSASLLAKEPLNNLKEKIFKEESLSEGKLEFELIKALIREPNLGQILLAKELWVDNAKNRKPANKNWKNLGEGVFNALINAHAFYEAILLLDCFQKKPFFDPTTRIKMLIRACSAGMTYQYSSVMATNIINLGKIAIAMLIHEKTIAPSISRTETSGAFLWLIDQLLAQKQTDMTDGLLRLVCHLDLISNHKELRNRFLRVGHESLAECPGAPIFTAHFWRIGKEKGVLSHTKEEDGFALNLAKKLLEADAEADIKEEAHKLGLELLESTNSTNLNDDQVETRAELWSKYGKSPLSQSMNEKLKELIKSRVEDYAEKWKFIKESINATTIPHQKELSIVPLKKLMEDLSEPTSSEQEKIKRYHLALNILGDPILQKTFSKNCQSLMEITFPVISQAISLSIEELYEKNGKVLCSLLNLLLGAEASTLAKETSKTLAILTTEYLISSKNSIPLELSFALKSGHLSLLAQLEEGSFYEEGLDLILTLDNTLKPREWHKLSLSCFYKLALGQITPPLSPEHYKKIQKTLEIAKKIRKYIKGPDSKLEAKLYGALARHCFRTEIPKEGLSWAASLNKIQLTSPPEKELYDDLVACAQYCIEASPDESLDINLLEKARRSGKTLSEEHTKTLGSIVERKLDTEEFLACANLLTSHADLITDDKDLKQIQTLAARTVEGLLNSTGTSPLEKALTLLTSFKIRQGDLWTLALKKALLTADFKIKKSAWQKWKIVENEQGYLILSPKDRLACWVSVIGLLEAMKHSGILTVISRTNELIKLAGDTDSTSKQLEAAILNAALAFSRKNPEIFFLENALATLFEIRERLQAESTPLIRLGMRHSYPQILSQCCDLLQRSTSQTRNDLPNANVPLITTFEDARNLANLQCPNAISEATKWTLQTIEHYQPPLHKKRRANHQRVQEQVSRLLELILSKGKTSQEFLQIAECIHRANERDLLDNKQISILSRNWALRQLLCATIYSWEKNDRINAVRGFLTCLDDISQNLAQLKQSISLSVDLALDLVRTDSEIELLEKTISAISNHLIKTLNSGSRFRKDEYMPFYFSFFKELIKAVANNTITNPEHAHSILTALRPMIPNFDNSGNSKLRREAAEIIHDYFATPYPGTINQQTEHFLLSTITCTGRLLLEQPDLARKILTHTIYSAFELLKKGGSDDRQQRILREECDVNIRFIIKHSLADYSVVEELITLYLYAMPPENTDTFRKHLRLCMDLVGSAIKERKINPTSTFFYKTHLYISFIFPKSTGLSPQEQKDILSETIKELIQLGESRTRRRATGLLIKFFDKITDPAAIEELITSYLHAIPPEDSDAFETHLKETANLLNAAIEKGKIAPNGKFFWKKHLYLTHKFPKDTDLTPQEKHTILVETIMELIQRREELTLIKAHAILEKHYGKFDIQEFKDLSMAIVVGKNWTKKSGK